MRNFITLVLILIGLPALYSQTACTNRCLDFDGTGDYVQSAAAPVTGNANFTLEARFQCTSTGSSFRRLLAFGGTNTRFEIGEVNGRIVYYRQSSAGAFGPSQISATVIRNNGWHHLAVRRDTASPTQELKFYLDCNLIFTTALGGTLNIGSFRVGNPTVAVTGTPWWTGQIDEVRVWNFARTDANISATCNCGLAGTESGLKLYYDFDQAGITPGGNNPGQTTVLDQTANANNGTLNTFALTGAASNWVCGSANFADCAGCVAEFSYTADTCRHVQFTNLTPSNPAIPPYSYSWNFGDGTAASTATSPSHTYAASGIYNVCLTISTAAGAIVCTTCHPVTVIADPILPMAKCAPPFSVQVSAGGFAPVLAGSINNGSTDNCGVASATISIDGFTCQDACPPNNQHAVVLTVTDLSGNTSTCTTVVTVVDVIKPVAKCKNVQVSVGANGTFTLPAASVDSASTDNCGIISMSVNPNIISCPKICPEFKTVTLTVTDCSGNSATCSAQVEVRDAIAPTVTCPQNITLHTSPNICQAIYPQALATMTDNCGATGTYTLTGATTGTGNGTGANPPFNLGFTTVQFVAKDVCNNSSACSYTVVVVDQEPPQIVCPANATIPCTPGTPVALVLPPPVVLSDNCTFNPTYITVTALTNPMPCNTSGIVTYIATDNSGNSAQCSYTVTASGTPPVCSCTGFSNLNFGTVGGKTLQVACGQPFTVPCPVAGTSFVLTGSLACSGSACAPSNMHWELTNSSNMLIGSGALGGASFSLPVSGTLIQAPGTYTLSLFGDCGQQTCRCDVKMVVEQCPPPGEALVCGDAVVTCFSGPNATVVAAVKKVQNITALGTGNVTQFITTSKSWLKQDFGEVFGTAIDKQGNIYFTSTTLYGPTPMGPQGYGGLYKVDGTTLNKMTSFPWIPPALPNAVGPVVSVNDIPSSPTTGAATSLTHAPGLGTVAYDKWNDQLFVTNFEDGKIYRINKNTGATLSTFDPMAPDNGTPGFAPLGERLWGVGVNKNPGTGDIEVFYAVWATDGRNRWANTPTFNTIRKVKLNVSGDFISGSDVQMIQLPLLPVAYLPQDDTDPNPGMHTTTAGGTAIVNPPYSNPVSDFAFTSDGNTMLVTEHSMTGDMKSNNNSTNWWAHSARTMEYKLIGGNWVFNRQIPIGVQFSFTLNGTTYTDGDNSSGGIDYANLNGKDNLNCDAMIWNTGDYLKIGGGPLRIYGMQGFYTNQATVTNTNSWLIDFDNDTIGTPSSDKSLNGDVEIFNCGSCPTSCDSISAFAVKDPQNRGCCYNLNLENHTPNTYTYVNICLLDGGTLTATAAAGWTVQGFSGNNALLQPNSGTVPVGTFPIAHFCVENLTADAQHIVVKYYDANFNVVCTDSILISCDACVQAALDSVLCEGANQYSFTVSVTAGDDLGYLANSVTIVPVGAVNFNVPTPNKTNADGSVVVSLPSLPPGGTIHNIPINISGSLPAGQTVCFYAIIHDNDLTKNESDTDCCADTVPVCFVLPDCDPCDYTHAEIRPVDSPTPSDSCCWKITLHNPDNYFTQVAVNVLTPGYQFSAIGSTIGSGWSMLSSSPTSASFDPIPPQGTGAYVVDGWTLPSMCFKPSGGSVVSPQKIEVVWKVDSVTCRDTLEIPCSFKPPCLEVDSIRVLCNPNGLTDSYIVVLGVKNTTSIPKGYLEVVGVTPGSVTVNPSGVYATFPPGLITFVTLNVTGPANTLACFRFALHQINDDSLHLNCCVMEDTICLTLPPCAFQCVGNKVQNGDFQQGLVGGDLDGVGNVDFWAEIPGSSPQVAPGSGCTQNGSILMWGNQEVGEGIRQTLSFTQGATYQLSLCGAWFEPSQPNARIRVRATSGNIITQSSYFPCTLPNCEEIFLTPVLTSSWTNYSAPLWTPQHNYDNLVLTVWNNFKVNDGAFVSWARLDDICIRQIQTTTPPDPASIQMSVYPNPANDQLNLAFDEPLPATTTVRIVDMTGRIRIQVKDLPAGIDHTVLDLSGLTDGMYVADVEVRGLVAIRKRFIVHRSSAEWQEK